MLKLKFQYIGHLVQRTDSLEKTLMLGKSEGRRRRGWPRMRWLDGVMDSTDVKVKVFQLCPTLCNPMDCTVTGILQARILEWVAFPFSRGSSQPRDGTQVSRIAGGFFTSWATRKAQEYWSGQPTPSPADLLNPGIELGLLHCRQILHLLFNWATREAHEFEQTPGDSEGQGSLACCSPWSCKELDTT